MTEDTRLALELAKPLADYFHIRLSADNKILYCNDQAIGINCNSTRATLDEIIGYLMITEWFKQRSYMVNLSDTRTDIYKAIKRYWISPKPQSMGEEQKLNS